MLYTKGLSSFDGKLGLPITSNLAQSKHFKLMKPSVKNENCNTSNTSILKYTHVDQPLAEILRICINLIPGMLRFIRAYKIK